MLTRQTFARVAISTMLASGLAPLPTARAQEGGEGLLLVPDYAGDLWHRSRLTGDWGGTRTDLAKQGVQIELDWTQYVQGVADGGIDRTTQYGGHLDYLVKLDLMRMGFIPGGMLTIRGESRYGNSVNGDVGVILPVNTTAAFPLTDSPDDDLPFALTNLYYTQFLSEKFALLLGKVDTLDADPNEFASGRGKSQFMDANFLFNSALALRLPYSALSAGATWIPSQNVSVLASVINTVDSSTTTGFDDFGDGLTASVEADFQYRLGELPGGMNIGVLYSFDQDFAKIGGRFNFQPGQSLAPNTADDTWAVYWSGWQYLFVEDPSDKPINAGDGVPDHQGFGVFSRFGFADPDTNPVEWSASVGLGGRGVVPSRDDDTFGVGYFYTRLRETRLTGEGPLAVFDDEAQGFEAFYNLSITPATHLTFDLQVQDPIVSTVNTVVIVGARLNLSF